MRPQSHGSGWLSQLGCSGIGRYNGSKNDPINARSLFRKYPALSFWGPESSEKKNADLECEHRISTGPLDGKSMTNCLGKIRLNNLRMTRLKVIRRLFLKQGWLCKDS